MDGASEAAHRALGRVKTGSANDLIRRGLATQEGACHRGRAFPRVKQTEATLGIAPSCEAHITRG